MTTKQAEEAAPWWERLADGSDESASKFLKPVVIIAVLMAVAAMAWSYLSESGESDRDRVAEVIYQGLSVLPDDPPRRTYGTILDPRYGRSGISLASFFYWNRTSEYQGLKHMYYGLVEPEKSKEFYDKILGVLGEYRDVEGDVDGSEDAWLFWLTRCELHWFAALNSPDVPTRIKHFKDQVSILDRMANDFADHPVMGLHPEPSEPDANIVTLWKSAAQGEIAFLEKNLDEFPEIKADEGLEAVITLDDGKSAKLEFYSAASPKAVATFLTHVAAGRYNGTAVHAVDSTAGTVSMGDPLSKIADRPMIWHKGDARFVVPPEATAMLPVKKGAVTSEAASTGGHGYHFVVHTKDPENPIRTTVFAQVVEGLEHFEALLDEEVFDDAGVENPSLPRRRIGIKSIVVTGEMQHAGIDSWKAARSRSGSSGGQRRRDRTQRQVPREDRGQRVGRRTLGRLQGRLKRLTRGASAPRPLQSPSPPSDAARSEVA